MTDKRYKRITKWYRRDGAERGWEFNHVEDGHVEELTPTPKNPIQKQSWPNAQWWKQYTFMDMTDYRLLEPEEAIEVYVEHLEDVV